MFGIRMRGCCCATPHSTVGQEYQTTIDGAFFSQFDTLKSIVKDFESWKHVKLELRAEV
jgi:hypothetical protein